MAAAAQMEGVVELATYPVQDPASSQFAGLAGKCRAAFLRDGIVTLPGFLTAPALAAAVQEVEGVKAAAWHTNTKHNVFLDSGDPALPADHVRNRQLPTTVASLAYDRLDHAGPLLRLYHTESFTAFLAAVLGLPALHRLADPLGAASINIFQPGTGHNWHFDESAFSVTLMLQRAEAGGAFRHTPPLREVGGEGKELYSALEAVLAGEEEVDSLRFEPGTLSIFSGSRCLHVVPTAHYSAQCTVHWVMYTAVTVCMQVTKVEGDRDRLVAVFCFSTRPGVRNSAKVSPGR
jgi:hypothetical protein